MTIVTAPPTSRFPNVFYQPITTPRRVGDVPADIAAGVGEANRGILNTPVFVGSPAEFRHIFGGMAANPASPGGLNPLSLYPTFLGFAYQGVRDKIMVRVASSLASTAFVTVSNGNGPMFALHAYDGINEGYSPGDWANGLTVKVLANANPAWFNLQITNSATGEVDTILNLNPTDPNLLATINAIATMVYATQPVVTPPQVAPTLTATAGSGTLPANTYFFVGTYTNAAGETVGSAEASVVLSATGNIAFSLPAMTGATGVKVYAATASGQEVFVGQNASGLSVTLNAPFAASTVQPPVANTAYTGPGNTAAVPTVQTISFPTAKATGVNPGNNGAGASTAQYVGLQGSPNTGLYSLTGITPSPNFVVLAEDAGGDATAYSQQAQIANDNGWIAVATFPRGTTDAGAKTIMAAQSALLGSPIAQYIKFAFPWVYIQDNELYKAPIKVSAASFLAGISAVQPANTAGANKPLSNLSGPEFGYSIAQMESLIANNVNVVTGLIPAAGVGFATDLMGSGDDGYLIRMRLLLAAGFQDRAGTYVMVPNTPSLRQRAHDDITAFLDGLAGEGLIPSNPVAATSAAVTPTPSTTSTAKGTQPSTLVNSGTTGGAAAGNNNYLVTCDDSNNVFNGVATRTLYIDVQVRVFPNTAYVLFRAEVGTDVQVSSAVAA